MHRRIGKLIRVRDVDLGDRFREVRFVVGEEPFCAGAYRRRQVNCVGGAKSVRRTECRGKFRGRQVHWTQVEPAEQCAELVQLLDRLLAQRLGQQFWQKQHRADPGDDARVLDRLGPEEGANSSTQLMLGHCGIDQDIRVEGIQRSEPLGPRSSGAHRRHENLGSLFAERRSGAKLCPAALFQKVAHAFRNREGVAGAARSESVWTDDHRDGLTVPRQCHLLAGKDAVKDLREGGSGLTDRHRRSHAAYCTLMYSNVRPIVIRKAPGGMV
jgi:hypothetical protein